MKAMPSPFLSRSPGRHPFGLGLVLLFLALAAVSVRADSLPVERFSYRVGWGIFRNAGFIEITRHAAEAGEPLRITTKTASSGVIRSFYAFDGTAESIYEPKGPRLLSMEVESGTRNDREKHALRFAYEQGAAYYTNASADGENERIAIPEGDAIDLTMCLLEARAWQLKPGDKKDVVVVFGDDFYTLTIHAERYEEVKTPLGTFQTVLLSPRMEKTPPKGMFKRGSSVRVWISQGEKPLPVKFEIKLKVGTGVASLIDYQSSADEKDPRP